MKILAFFPLLFCHTSICAVICAQCYSEKLQRQLDGKQTDYVKSKLAHLISITITHFDVEFDLECSHDVLIVGEGKNNDIIHRYCNRENENGTTLTQGISDRFKEYRSHSRYITLTWMTDNETSYKGWRIAYEFVDEGDGCGFTTHAMTGVLHSPNFPKDYPNDFECIWDIQVPPGYHINLIFTHFDIELTEQCENDALIISEEHSARGMEPLGEYYFIFQNEEKKPPMCGFVLPKPVTTTSNRMRLNFTTNEKINAVGFKAEWEAVCGAVFRLGHYTIVSPNYPTGYPNNNTVCQYLIQPEEGDMENNVIVFKMLDFDLNDMKTEIGRYPCESDYVEVFNAYDNEVVYTYCGGNEESDQAMTVKGAMGIRFVTNRTFLSKDFKNNKGFKLSYTMKKCGGDIFLRDGRWMTTISSPAFPLAYPHDLDCWWNITTVGDRILTTKIVALELEDMPECDMDWVEMFDGSNYTDTNRMGRYCGSTNKIPKNHISTSGNNMLVHFVSDRSMALGGFKMVVTATLGPKHGCGGQLEAKADWQTLSPPMNGTEYYNNLYCGWTILGKAKTMIELKLVSIDTEKLIPLPGETPEKKCVDFIRIYDGYKIFSPILVDDLCTDTATPLPLHYHTAHRVAHVYFQTDNDGTGKGFQLQYRSIVADCGEWVTPESIKKTVSFDSKSLTDAHNGQIVQRCRWVVHAPEQAPIWIHFKNLTIPSPSGDCSDAFIEIRDVGTLTNCLHPACAPTEMEKKVVRYCGTANVPTFISNTLAVQVVASVVLSDRRPASFIMEYEYLSSCNRTVDTTDIPSGRVTSPNFPNPYSHNSSCTTIVKAPQDRIILLVFRRFQLERGRMFYFQVNNVTNRPIYHRVIYTKARCDHDYLQISEPDYNATTQKYCGSGIMQTFLSKGPTLELYLQTDDSVSTQGFDASYYTGKYDKLSRTYTFASIHDAIGAVSNIGYSSGYNASTTQRFTIQPPTGLSCRFSVTALSLAIARDGVDCVANDEYLLIEYKKSSSSEPVPERMRSCSHEAPVEFDIDAAEDRKVHIEFKSDEITENDGTGFRITWECGNYEGPTV